MYRLLRPKILLFFLLLIIGFYFTGSYEQVINYFRPCKQVVATIDNNVEIQILSQHRKPYESEYDSLEDFTDDSLGSECSKDDYECQKNQNFFHNTFFRGTRQVYASGESAIDIDIENEEQYDDFIKT